MMNLYLMADHFGGIRLKHSNNAVTVLKIQKMDLVNCF